MATNKVTVDGTTIIDLSTTGIETADDIPAGKYGYLRTGQRVVGTGGNMSANPLNGKTLAITGDSIAAGAGNSGNGYGEMIATANNMTLQNISEGGGAITPSQTDFCISTSISSLRADADYVLLEGGFNDSARMYALGTLTSGYTDTLDTSTFAGAFENMLKSAIARFPNKKIGYIITHKCIDRFNSMTSNSYYGIAKTACEKWGIPYCDLNVLCPPLGYIDALSQAYTDDNDGIHPNADGYAAFYVPKITAWMKTL